MLKSNFYKEVEKIFDFDKVKYNFSLIKGDNEVTFLSKKINFRIYFERNFEIYIVFILKDKNLQVDLQSIVRYLNLEKVYLNSIIKNQISNESDIKFVLNGLKVCLDDVLEIISSDDDLLYNSYLLQQKILKEKYTEYKYHYIEKLLFECWQNKDYKKFIEIYNTSINYDIEKFVKEKVRKQLEYSKTQTNN